MNDALAMRCRERTRDLDCEFQNRLQLHRLARNLRPQALALQQLHGDEVPSICRTNLVHFADVGMIERRSRQRLSFEARARLRVPFQFRRKPFQRHPPARVQILRFVQHTVALASKLRQDAVVRNGFGDHEEEFRAG